MRRFYVKVNGTPYNVEIEEINGSAQTETPYYAPVAPQQPIAPAPQIPAEQPAPETPAAKAKDINSVSGTQITCPMPGTIVKIPVKDGDAVKKGDVVAVLESMKMENDIVSPAAGTVSVAVKQGANLNSGDLIAVIS